jgi:hypothetical protein
LDADPFEKMLEVFLGCELKACDWPWIAAYC